MSTRKKQRDQSVSEEPPLHERLQRQRDQLFKATSMLDCCRYATASKLKYDDLEFMAHALLAISDLVDETAGELGVIIDELEAVQPEKRLRVKNQSAMSVAGRLHKKTRKALPIEALSR